MTQSVTEIPEKLDAALMQIALMQEFDTAFLSRAIPGVKEKASPYQWANTCHELFEAGRIDLVEYAARYLHVIYPELTYVSTLVSLFDAMPSHLPPPLHFRDDPEAEIQVVRRLNCRDALLCFCARHGTLGFPLNFIHLWLGRLPVSVVYVKDLRELYGGHGYRSLGSDRESTVSGLRRLLAQGLGAERIYTLGVSGGGYPALYYGLKIGANAALTLSGQTDLTPEFNDRHGPVSRAYQNFLQRIPDYAKDLREIYQATDRRPRVLMAYCDGHSRDRHQAQQFAELSNVELVPMRGDRHNVLHPLIVRRQFLPLLNRLLSVGDSS
jgi:hypothetical protein